MATQLQVAAGLYYSLTHDSSSEYLCALYICDSVFCGAHVKDDECNSGCLLVLVLIIS